MLVRDRSSKSPETQRGGGVYQIFGQGSQKGGNTCVLSGGDDRRNKKERIGEEQESKGAWFHKGTSTGEILLPEKQVKLGKKAVATCVSKEGDKNPGY